MSKEKNIKTYELIKQDRFLGILVHLLTGLGIVAGFFALIAVMNNNQKAAFLWLGLRRRQAAWPRQKQPGRAPAARHSV